MSLHVAGRTVSVECTLGETRKHLDHRIESNAPVPFGEAEHLPAVRTELAAEETVHHDHLQNHVHQVQRLREAVEPEAGVVRVLVARQVADQEGAVRRLRPLVHDRVLQAEQQALHLATLGGLPDVSRHVEEQRLEEEHLWRRIRRSVRGGSDGVRVRGGGLRRGRCEGASNHEYLQSKPTGSRHGRSSWSPVRICLHRGKALQRRPIENDRE